MIWTKKRGIEILKMFNPLEAKLTAQEYFDNNPGYRIRVFYTAAWEEGLIQQCILLHYTKKPFFLRMRLPRWVKVIRTLFVR